MKLSPVVLFVCNRLAHTKRTVQALRLNVLAEKSELIIFSDAPKSEIQADAVIEVRKYIHQIDGFKSITIVERELNYGLSHSIIDGVTRIVNKYGRIIVLEDDMVTSPYFLSYMNEALDKYEMDSDVASIHGYVYPVKQELPEAFFLPGADCWGWGTWSRGWACFNSDGQYLLSELRRRKLIHAFDYNGSYPYSKMLEAQIKGSNDSWAIRWYASAFLADKLTLYPGRSLVHNIGNDDSGTHCVRSDYLDADLSNTQIDLSHVDNGASSKGRQVFEAYFRQMHRSLLKRLEYKILLMTKVLWN